MTHSLIIFSSAAIILLVPDIMGDLFEKWSMLRPGLFYFVLPSAILLIWIRKNLKLFRPAKAGISGQGPFALTGLSLDRERRLWPFRFSPRPSFSASAEIVFLLIYLISVERMVPSGVTGGTSGLLALAFAGLGLAWIVRRSVIRKILAAAIVLGPFPLWVVSLFS